MLYHYQIGFPKNFNSNVGTRLLKYTRHALGAANSDKYGTVELPVRIDTAAALCVEIETGLTGVEKLVYRMPYDARLDLCIVVIPVENYFLVKTVWLNEKTDGHSTLEKTKYAKEV